MLLNNKLCADVGTVNCPCYLAEYGKCIVCSRLGGSGVTGAGTGSTGAPAVCGCSWQGVCIYNEYLQNNQCINDPAGDREGGCGERRQSRLCEIQKIKWFENDLAVMRIGVPRGMAEKASLPGSFVFVKRPGAESYFEFPVSVMRSDYEDSALELAVKIMGPKSRALLEQYRGIGLAGSQIDDAFGGGRKSEACGYVELRGIYRNGMLGAEKLMDIASKRVLCLTKGVGLAPAVNYIRWADGRDKIDVIADLDKVNREFAEYALGANRSGQHSEDAGGHVDGVCSTVYRRMEGVESVVYGSLPLNLPWAESEKYDVIIISASDYYQKNIYVPEAKKVLSNNHSMCCGEGICGACIGIDGDGVVHRMCKCCRD